MSIDIKRYIKCDNSGCTTTWAVPTGEGWDRISRVRSYLRSLGWASVRDGKRRKDYCPTHSASALIAAVDAEATADREGFTSHVA